MSVRYLIILAAVILTAGSAQAEILKSLEYGVSFEYHRDLKPSFASAQVAIGLNGPESTKVDLFAFESSSNLSTLNKLAILSERIFQQIDPSFSFSTSENKTIGMTESIEKAGLIRIQNKKGETEIQKMRILYFKNGDMLYMLMCEAPEYYYNRANQMYFAPLINSLKIFPVDNTPSKCIPGFPSYTSKKIWSSPLIVDLDGDKSLEIVAGSNEGKLYAWKKDGSEVKGFPFTAEDMIRSSPAFGDVNGDGKGEIVFGSDDGRLYALTSDGKVLPGFPKVIERAIRSSPALADIDNDGSDEIVFGSLDTGLYCLKGDGSTVCGFPIITGYSSIASLWSSPALGDLNGDGGLDAVIGTTTDDSTLSSILGQEIPSGKIFAVDRKGKALYRFPISMGMLTVVGYDSPILADINGDGSLEIIIGSSKGLHCLSARGDDIPGFPITTDGSLQDSFLAVGDLDEDGRLEIVAGAYDGRLYIWRSDGSDYPGFPIQTGGFVRHITLGDIDNDGKQEILGGSSDNRVHAWKLDGSEVLGFPKVTMGDIETAPTLGDLDKDGTLELTVGSDDGSLYVWTVSKSYGKLQWPMIRQNSGHTGVYKPS